MWPSRDTVAGILTGLEQRICEAETTCAAFVSSVRTEGLPSRQELMKQAIESTLALSAYYRTNSRYLTESLAQNVDQLVGKTREIWVHVGMAQRLIGLDALTQQQREQAWSAAQHILFQEIPDLYQKIERQVNDLVHSPSDADNRPASATH